MTRRLLVVPMVAIRFAFVVPRACADPPTPTDIVAQLNTDQRVYVDSEAAPKLADPKAINDQILRTGSSMIVINVAASQTAPTDASPRQSTDPFYDALYATHNPLTNDIQVDGKPHRPPLIILVFDSKNYHAFAYDVSASIAAATGPDMIQAAAEHHGDTNGAISAFISRLAGSQVTGPVWDNSATVSPTPASAPSTTYSAPRNHTLAWAFGSVLVGLFVVGMAIALVFTLAEGRRAKANDREVIQDRINRARKDVDRLAHEVLKGKDVSVEQNSAAMSVGTAEAALRRGDMASARSHVGIAEAEIAAAYAVVNPGRRVHRRAFDDVPKAPRRTGITARSRQGKRVTVSNSDYKRRSVSGYRNYYPGGMCGGVPFPAGWYPYPFWVSSGAAASTDTAGSVGGADVPLVSTDYGSWSGGASAPIYLDPTPSMDFSGGASAAIYPDPTPSMDFGGSGFVGDSSGGGNAGL
jgi:hypothetical protein